MAPKMVLKIDIKNQLKKRVGTGGDSRPVACILIAIGPPFGADRHGFILCRTGIVRVEDRLVDIPTVLTCLDITAAVLPTNIL